MSFENSAPKEDLSALRKTLNFCIHRAEDLIRAVNAKDTSRYHMVPLTNRNLKNIANEAIGKGVLSDDAKVEHVEELINKLNAIEADIIK